MGHFQRPLGGKLETSQTIVILVQFDLESFSNIVVLRPYLAPIAAQPGTLPATNPAPPEKSSSGKTIVHGMTRNNALWQWMDPRDLCWLTRHCNGVGPSHPWSHQGSISEFGMACRGGVSRELPYAEWNVECIPGVLPLSLTRSSLGFGQDDRGSRHGEEQCDLARAEVVADLSWLTLCDSGADPSPAPPQNAQQRRVVGAPSAVSPKARPRSSGWHVEGVRA
jgi:hypothetical protein